MLKEKLLIFLINTLLLHIPLLALMDGRNYRGTNTLAARGLEELFSVVLLSPPPRADLLMFWQGEKVQQLKFLHNYLLTIYTQKAFTTRCTGRDSFM
jgi:hypothetical protein